MICLIANNFREARSWAESQLLEPNEWFHISDIDGLLTKTNFHVIVVGTCDDIKSYKFEKMFSLAKQRGRIGR